MDDFDDLRRLSVDAYQDASGAPARRLDPRTQSLVRLGALVAVAAAAPSIRREVDDAISAGATAADVVAVLDAIEPHVGRPRVVKAAPRVALALGVDLDLLADEP